MARVLEGALRGHRQGAEILILSRDGTVLLGPPALQGAPLPRSVLAGGRPLDPEGTSRVGPWPDGAAYLSARASTAGHRDYPGLGWQVVVRQTADRALASVAALRGGILATGSAVALAAALLAWLLAGLIARPLLDLAAAAETLGRDQPLPPLPRSFVREGATIADALAAAADERARRAETHRLLIDELNHRVKNTLATVQAMAAQSLKNLGAGAEAGRDAFEARLLALSRAHDILTRESWASADLRGIAAQAVRPFLGPEPAGGDPSSRDCSGREASDRDTSGLNTPRITLDGPDLRLPPEGALALTMILHELCTNAVKHGALSVPGGRAALAWTVEAGPDTETLRLTWRECGGPPVVSPSRKGFGTRLLERGLAGAGPPASPTRPAASSTRRPIPCPPPAAPPRRVRTPDGPDPAPARTTVVPASTRHRAHLSTAGRRPRGPAPRRGTTRAVEARSPFNPGHDFMVEQRRARAHTIVQVPRIKDFVDIMCRCAHAIPRM
ncbi:sensor histidine kinase [Methylobacterium sp. NMS12]|uniref:sensor histidine kinase n=1 Tax=Methylobacterium sp. NMS12 TaxID=3079766 RepID=UPI003F884120